MSVIIGDCREEMRRLIDQGVKVQCCVTSPPYWGLRDYGVGGQLGLETTPEEFIANLVEVFGLVRELLADDGTLWLNIGDSYTSGGRDYRDAGKSNMNGGGRVVGLTEKGKRAPTPAGMKPKDLVGIPWMLAFALRAEGWYLRQDIIWSKPNPMPESVTDRCTKAHEYIFLFSKSPKYYFNQEAILEPVSPGTHASARKMGRPSGWAKSDKREKIGRYPKPKDNENFNSAMVIMPETRNKRSVWTVNTQGLKEAHFATYPPKLIEPCILAGTRPGDTVIDPFSGSGTTGMVAYQHGRKYLGIELNPDYAAMSGRRMTNVQIDLLTSQGEI